MTAISFYAVDVLNKFGNLSLLHGWFRKSFVIPENSLLREFVETVVNSPGAVIPRTPRIYLQFIAINSNIGSRSVAKFDCICWNAHALLIRAAETGKNRNYNKRDDNNDFGN